SLVSTFNFITMILFTHDRVSVSITYSYLCSSFLLLHSFPTRRSSDLYLILIPSESTVPAAVREALGSAFHNIYAEGYPLEETRAMTEAEILDYNARLPEYRRFADKRYYKGTEYANIVESLARRRAAEL